VRLKILSSLLYQRTSENEWVVHSGLLLLILVGFAQALIGQRVKAVKVLSQVHRTSRSQWMRQLVETYIRANRDAVHADLLPSVSPNITTLFGNRLMVLKAPAPEGEKGVLLVMFTEMIRLLHSSMNLPQLLQDYTLVFEPSWSGYCHPEFLQFTHFSEEIFVLAAEENDFAFLQRLGSNLIPVDLGPCDWVDPRVAAPYLPNSKEFDIVMNSNWAAWKRHYVLFRMLARAKQRYKVVLIGVKWAGKTAGDIETLADFYGVRGQITILERLSYEKVMDVNCRSKVSILLSLKEGSNRAIAESVFCNVPVVVLSSHVGGIRKNIVPQTGVLTDERHLESAIGGLLCSSLRPREWAMKNISCFISSDKLNARLREHALRKGRPWTKEIAGRSNSPESKYICDADAEHLRPWNQGLANYLRRV
jgi:hypothetical protein